MHFCDEVFVHFCVSAFVDDWSTSIKSLADLRAVREIIRTFEMASGQKINSEKSALVPSRRLTTQEANAVQHAWGSKIKISYCERVLGVYVGLEATVETQYATALAKLDAVLQVYTRIRSELTVAMRTAVANVFMVSLFSYANRHFWMPAEVLQKAESMIGAFIAPIGCVKIRMLSHLRGL